MASASPQKYRYCANEEKAIGNSLASCIGGEETFQSDIVDSAIGD